MQINHVRISLRRLKIAFLNGSDLEWYCDDQLTTVTSWNNSTKIQTIYKILSLPDNLADVPEWLLFLEEPPVAFDSGIVRRGSGKVTNHAESYGMTTKSKAKYRAAQVYNRAQAKLARKVQFGIDCKEDSLDNVMDRLYDRISGWREKEEIITVDKESFK